MKHTMLTKQDAIIIPAGVSAPTWVPAMTEWLGLPIAFFTLMYIIIKVIDMLYQWRHRWNQRKSESKEFIK